MRRMELREEATTLHIERAATLLNNTHRHGAKTKRRPASSLPYFSRCYGLLRFRTVFQGICNHRENRVTNRSRQNDFSVPSQTTTNRVIRVSNPYLLADLARFNDYDNLCEHAVTVAVSRALSLALEYFANGDERHYDASQSVLDTALSIASTYWSPALWWIVRLLKLVLADGRNFSMWELLPPYFLDNSDLLARYMSAYYCLAKSQL